MVKKVMTEEDKDIWVDFKANVSQTLPYEYKKILCNLHANYYEHPYTEPCSCNGKTYKLWIADIDRIYGG